MKSTQDLVRFIQQLSNVDGKQTPIMIYPDKSFVVYEQDSETGDLEVIYSSADATECFDINDLPYEDPIKFAAYMEDLVEAEALIQSANLVKPADKYDNL